MSSDPDEEDFWDARKELRTIRDFARAQIAPPWCVLGCVFVRIVCEAPPSVVLPKIVGSYASLNLSVAYVGHSGDGKGISASVARDVLSCALNHRTARLGSGQGMSHQYVKWDSKAKEHHVIDPPNVLFRAEEIDSVLAHTNQNASTLLADLRSFGVGEELGGAYATAEKSLKIPPHSYRGAVEIGVQPGRGQMLFDHAEGGTPQRFIWLPTTDSDAPEHIEDLPAIPTRLDWRLPEKLPKKLPGPSIRGQAFRPLPVEEEIENYIRQEILNRRRNRSQDNQLDSHTLLTWLKVAAALALLDRRYEVDGEDWELAEHVMRVSNKTRSNVQEYLAELSRKENVRRGQSQGEREVIAETAKQEEQLKRVSQKIKRALARSPEKWFKRGEIRSKLDTRDREYLDEALNSLVRTGVVDVRPIPGKGTSGKQYRINGGEI